MRKIIIIGFLSTILIFTLSNNVMCQPPRPPVHPGEDGGTPIGGVSAPIDGGLSILLLAAGIFGSRKYIRAKQD